MPRATPIVALCLLGILSYALDGHARGIETDASECPSLDVVRFDELLSIELATLERRHVPRPVLIRISCSEAQITLTVSDADAAQSRTTALRPTAPDPDGQARLLALSASELIAELWEQPATPLPERESPVPNRSAAEPREPPTTPPKRAHLAAAFDATSVGKPRGPLYGAAADFEYTVSRGSSLAAGATYLRGSTATDSANVDTSSAGVRLGGYAGFQFSRFHVAVGPSFEASYIRLAPHSDLPGALVHDVSGLWSGVALRARARLFVSSDWFVSVVGNSGIVLTPVIGLRDGIAPELSIDGAWFGGSVGAGVAF